MTQQPIPAKLTTWATLSIVLAVVAGCSKTAEVSGKVSYQGRPVTHGSVILLCDDQTARSGVIQPDGTYRVEQAPRGSAVKIGVISRDPAKGRSAGGRKGVRCGTPPAPRSSPAVAGWFPLPSQYESPEISGLSCQLAAGRVRHDIELK